MPFLTPFYVVFFFPRSVFFFLVFFFFSWKSLRLTHSLISNVCIFLFPVSEKKKYSVFTHSLDLVKNITKINFSWEIKKYGTFVGPLPPSIFQIKKLFFYPAREKKQHFY